MKWTIAATGVSAFLSEDCRREEQGGPQMLGFQRRVMGEDFLLAEAATQFSEK